jgi:hypothetical protein
MTRAMDIVAFVVAGCLSCVAADSVTTTGWIADESCATVRAKAGTYTPTNPDCAMQCIAKGKQMVLVAEKEKAVYVIDNPDVARNHFAEHLQITGTLDRSSNRLHILSLKDLGDYQGPACARPKH